MTKTPTTHVVYHVASTMEAKSYKSAHAARVHCDKMNKAVGGYAVADRETYETKVVHMVERVNLMSGKTYLEPSNTPAYLSPSRESYWSM